MTEAETGSSRDRPRAVAEIDAAALSRVFSAPTWLRDLGLLAWFVLGVSLVVIGATWLATIASSIVVPVILGGVIASVAAPVVRWLQSHGAPRSVGAAAVVVGLVAVGVLVVVLVIGGIVDHSAEIKASLQEAADTVASWFEDVDANDTAGTQQAVEVAVSASGTTFLEGLAEGIRGLTSVVLMITFALFSTFFLLKDGPDVRRFIDRHLGVPPAVATTITGNVIVSLRRYFFGVSMVAAFNAVVVGLGAYFLGVPLWGTIALVTFVTAYVPYIGAFVAGAFTVLLTLSSQGTTAALVMLVIFILANGLLQNLFQPLAYGATLDLNPLAVLIVTIGGGCLFGMVGLILGAPLTSAAVYISRDLAAARMAAGSSEAK